MLENNDLDRLIKIELTQTRHFDNNDNQWEIVHSRLKKRFRIGAFWLLSALTLICVVNLLLSTDVENISDGDISSSKMQNMEEPPKKLNEREIDRVMTNPSK